MGEWLLSRRDSTIVARHEVPGPAVWTFSCAYSKRPKDERKTTQGFSPGKVRRLALPKQDRIMLPAGLQAFWVARRAKIE